MQRPPKLFGPVILNGIHILHSDSADQRPIEPRFDGDNVTPNQRGSFAVKQWGFMDRKSQPVARAMRHGDGVGGLVLAGESESKSMGLEGVYGGLVDGRSFHSSSKGQHCCCSVSYTHLTLPTTVIV